MLRRFFSYYKPYKGLFMLDFSCAVIAGLLGLGFPLIVNQFIDKLLPGQDWTLILWSCTELLAIYVLNAGLQYVVTYWGHMLGVNIETDMRQKLFDHIQKLSFRFFDNNKTGHLISRLTNDLVEIGEIAHRLATIKNADRIVVVNKDGIAEQGPHEELIEQGGGYSRLYEAQFSS